MKKVLLVMSLLISAIGLTGASSAGAQADGVLVGRVVNLNGLPVAAQLFIVPHRADNNATLQAVGSARVDSNGAVLALPPINVSADRTQRAQFLVALTSTDGRMAIQPVQLARDGSSWRTSSTPGSGVPRPEPVGVAASMSSDVVSAAQGNNGFDIALSMPVAQLASAGVAAAGPVAPASCIRDVVQTFPNVRVWLGQTHTQARQTALFEYTTSGESSLGVGIAASGGTFSISAGGEKTVGTGQTIGFGSFRRTNTSVALVTEAFYDRVRYTCSGMGGNVASTFRIEPRQVNGGNLGFTIARPPRPTINTNCVPYRAGDFYIKDNTANTKYSNGVNLKAYGFSLDLSSRSGYSTAVRTTWNFSGASWLCGDTGKPIAAGTLSAWDA